MPMAPRLPELRLFVTEDEDIGISLRPLTLGIVV